MAGTIKRFGPAAIVGGAVYNTNIMQGGGFTVSSGSALVYDIVRHIHFANKLAADTFRLYLGGTGGNVAGTELFFDYPVAAKQSYDYYCVLKATSTDFFVGGAVTTLTLVITIEGESYVV